MSQKYANWKLEQKAIGTMVLSNFACKSDSSMYDVLNEAWAQSPLLHIGDELWNRYWLIAEWPAERCAQLLCDLVVVELDWPKERTSNI